MKADSSTTQKLQLIRFMHLRFDRPGESKHQTKTQQKTDREKAVILPRKCVSAKRDTKKHRTTKRKRKETCVKERSESDRLKSKCFLFGALTSKRFGRAHTMLELVIVQNVALISSRFHSFLRFGKYYCIRPKRRQGRNLSQTR